MKVQERSSLKPQYHQVISQRCAFLAWSANRTNTRGQQMCSNIQQTEQCPCFTRFFLHLHFKVLRNPGIFRQCRTASCELCSQTSQRVLPSIANMQSRRKQVSILFISPSVVCLLKIRDTHLPSGAQMFQSCVQNMLSASNDAPDGRCVLVY